MQAGANAISLSWQAGFKHGAAIIAISCPACLNAVS